MSAQKGWQVGFGAGKMFLTPSLNKDGLIEKEWLFNLPLELGGQDVFRIVGKNPWTFDMELSYSFSKHWAIQSGFQYRSRRFLFISADYDPNNPILRVPGSVYTNNVPFHKDMQMYSIPVTMRYTFGIPKFKNWRLSLNAGVAIDQYEMNRRIRDKKIDYSNGIIDNSFSTTGIFNFVTDYSSTPAYYMSLRYGLGIERVFRKGNRIKLEVAVVDNSLLNDVVPNYLNIDMRDIVTADQGRTGHDVSTKHKFSLYQTGIMANVKYFFKPFRVNKGLDQI
jgi:hypothetical protein